MIPANLQQNLIVIEGHATYERILSGNQGLETDEAIKNIQNFIKIYPELALAHNDLAVLYYQAGNNLKALAHYEKAHKLDPSNVTFRKNLADFYFVELEWTDDAIQTYLDILKDNPFDIETLNALGTISLKIGRREQSRQYFSRTLQLDTVNSQARQALQLLEEQVLPPAQPARIATDSSRAPAGSNPPPTLQAPAVPVPAAQFSPLSPDDHYRQAVEAAKSGARSEARRILEALLTSTPGYALAYNDLGVICQEDGNYGKARNHFEQAVRLQPLNINFQKNLADLLYIACGETEEAMKLYLKILGANPRDIETLRAVSHICIEAGKLDDARSFLETILNIEPWNHEARESLARVKETESVQPASQRNAEHAYAEAQRLAQEDRINEARALLEELVLLNPEHAVGFNDLGVMRYRMGDKEGACYAYERAVELQPANLNFRKNLADLYFTEFGRTDDAIRIYLDIHRQHPRDLETLAGLGHICAAVGRPEEAKSFYRRALEIEPWNREVRETLQKLTC